MSNEKVLSKEELEKLIAQVYVALCEKGYDPSSQIAGYILSEDPVYMPDWNNARSAIQQVDRDELLHLLIDFYIDNKLKKHDQIDNL
ncbi:MAG: IreB family regulatory phosphoprotein [Ruminococcaceae bacterium]|nr:IreB family regulatory phosphoprotein [Oscillospiraceae bacterium]